MNRQQVIEILRQVTFRDWRLTVDQLGGYDPVYGPLTNKFVSFHWRLTTECSKTGKMIPLRSGPTLIDLHPGLNEHHVIIKVRDSIHNLVLHEADEFFRYRGVMIFDPHIGEPGYVPERTTRPRQAFIPPNKRYTLAQATYSSVAIGVGYDEGVHDIDPADYTRFR